jgi:hypothetical protein
MSVISAGRTPLTVAIATFPRTLNPEAIIRFTIKFLNALRAQFNLMFINQTPASLKHALSQPWVRFILWLEDKWPALRAPEPADRVDFSTSKIPTSFHHLQTVYPTLTFRQARGVSNSLYINLTFRKTQSFQEYVKRWAALNEANDGLVRTSQRPQRTTADEPQSQPQPQPPQEETT